jgi:3-dehydroquinate dehydratase/shikimate dehydrogenase
MGNYGTNTRILAEKLGSHLSYCFASGKDDIPPGAPAQLDPKEMTGLYRFREIKKSTRVYGLTGFPLKTSFSPHIFNTIFSFEKIDAVYVPFPSDTLDGFLNIAKETGMEGASITIPYKEEVIPLLSAASDRVAAVGACNTIAFDQDGGNLRLHGYNTDCMGFSESLLLFLGKKNLHRLGVTVLGAGGAARAAVEEIHRLKGKCLILNRNAVRARELALRYKAAWGSLDSQGLDMMYRYSDVIIQTTPVGTSPNVDDDPFGLYHFTGREAVMDLIYNPEKTAFLRRAEEAGCRILNGFDMLIRQAKHQYQFFFGREFPMEILPRIMAAVKGYG